MKNSGQRRALVVGATGLVGGHVLTRLAENERYSNIFTFGRRAPDFEHPRVVHHVADLADASEPAQLPGADVLFCCLGTTIKQAGSEAAFRAVDFELVVRLAARAVESGAQTLVLVSSVGADADSRNFYLRTKGETERAVSALAYARLGILRPSLLLGAREELRPAEKLGQSAASFFNPLLMGGLKKYRAVDANIVAAAMVGFDLSDATGKHVIEGEAIRRLAGE